MRKLFLLFLLFSFGIIFQLTAQSSKPLRIEIATKEDTDPYVMINCSSLGALVFFQTVQEVGVDSLVWSFYMFDKNLKEAWRKGIGLGKEYRYIDYSHKANDSLVFLLFQDKRRTEKENTIILTVNVLTGLVLEVKGLISAKSKINHFIVDNGYAFIAIIKNDDDIELDRMSIKKGDILQFVLPESGKSDILDLQLNVENQHVVVVNRVSESKTSTGIVLLEYSYNGLLENTIVFDKPDSKQSYNTAEIVYTGTSKGLIFGVYGNSGLRTRSLDTYEDQNPPSAGYFIAGFEHGNSMFMNYYNFSEFRDFFRYITGEDAVRLKKKNIEKNRKGNSRDGDLNYQFLVHPVIKHDSSYILIGEAYYPEYHTVTNMVYDYYGRPMPTSYSVFDGFRYTSAFIASFDSLGAMHWSNGMEMQGILTNFLNRKFSCTFDGADAMLTYNSGGILTAKTIRGTEVLEQNNSVPIAMLHANDKVVKDYLSAIEPWYGDFFIAYGYHTIRNNDLSDNRRTVFYINKIAFR
jgi:hypothetical protein